MSELVNSIVPSSSTKKSMNISTSTTKKSKKALHNTSEKLCKLISRPCIQQVYDKVLEINNTTYVLPKTANKGKPGNYLEELTGIPTSSECLDCTDGEVKVFPLKKLKNGEFVPKETIAVTMINKDTLKKDSFIESRCFKKMTQILYIPYYRDGDNITYMTPTIVNLNDKSNEQLKKQLNEDYESIRKFITDNHTLDGSSKLGKYLQNRTKGAGKDKPKTRAFYLRPIFMKDFVKI
jgi:DNA mismatch repair protein MutH